MKRITNLEQINFEIAGNCKFVENFFVKLRSSQQKINYEHR